MILSSQSIIISCRKLLLNSMLFESSNLNECHWTEQQCFEGEYADEFHRNVSHLMQSHIFFKSCGSSLLRSVSIKRPLFCKEEWSEMNETGAMEFGVVISCLTYL